MKAEDDKKGFLELHPTALDNIFTLYLSNYSKRERSFFTMARVTIGSYPVDFVRKLKFCKRSYYEILIYKNL